MESQTSVQVGKGIPEDGILTPGQLAKEVKEMAEVVFTKDDLAKLRAKKAEQDKTLRKADKALVKEQARAKDFTPDKVEALKLQAAKDLQAEGERLQAEVDQQEVDIDFAQLEVDNLQAKTAKSIQDLETIQGISGLHRNSPKKLAPSPWSYAIPISILGSVKELYPGQFSEVIANGKPYMLKSVKGQVWVDFSNFVTLKVTKGFGKSQVVYERNYSQGLTKWFRTLLNNIMPKAA